MHSARATVERGMRPRAARARRLQGQPPRSQAAAASEVSSRRGRVLVEQPVAEAPYRLDQVRTPQLLAQLRDVDVDGARSARKRHPPHAVEEPLAGQDLAGVSRELCKQLELERPERKR